MANQGKKITEDEKAFCDAYVANGYNAMKAWMKTSGEEDKVKAAQKGFHLLQQKRIQDFIEVIGGDYKRLTREKGLDRGEIVEELKEIIKGKWDFLDKKTGTVVSMRNAPKDINAAITTLCKLIGDFAPEKQSITVDEKAGDIDISKMTDEEKSEMRARLLREL